jgi:uncharacterized UBP type Zn finger protein
MVIGRRSGNGHEDLTPEELERDLQRDTPFRRFRQRLQTRREARETPPPEPTLCEHLLAAPARDVGSPTTCDAHADTDGPVVHLRACLTCGFVGCCDSSKGHATAHAASTGHPVMQSAEPGESWRWCYPHEMLG